MLHIVSHSSSQFDVQALLRSVNEADAVLFVQDGVSIAIKNNPVFQQLLETQANIYALQEDLQARGMLHLVCQDVTIVDYYKYVDLTVKYTPQLLW